MKTNKKYIIVGQGLTGSILGYIFEKNNIEYKIYDNGINHSTRIAAGLINPVVFKRLNKCFGADHTIEFAYSFYQEIESKLGVRFIEQREYCRIFASIEEENNWLAKQNLPEFQNHIQKIPYLPEKSHSFNTPFGQGFVKNAGFMHTEVFLDSMNNFFCTHKRLVSKSFDYASVPNLEAEGYEIIFCEGYYAKKNPYFNYLPLNTTKGEVIDVHHLNKKIDCIINKGVFVLPLEDDVLRVGATYEWHNDDPSPSKNGINQLIEKLSVLEGLEYDVKTHKAGIRPTVKDRRPLIGTHPKHKQLHIVNGMGTRGVALAPFWIHEFYSTTLDGQNIDQEVNISRFE